MELTKASYQLFEQNSLLWFIQAKFQKFPQKLMGKLKPYTLFWREKAKRNQPYGKRKAFCVSTFGILLLTEWEVSPRVHTVYLGIFSAKSTWVDKIMTDSLAILDELAVCRLFLEHHKALEVVCLSPVKIVVRLLVFLEVEINRNQSQESMSSVYLF